MSGTGLDLAVLKDYFSGLQTCIVGELEALDGRPFRRDEWVRHGEQPGPSGQSSSSMPNRPADEMASGSDLGGSGMVCLIEEGDLFERGGVNFSHVRGRSLPPAASARRPHLTGRRFEAMGVSLVLHPRNPYCPTAHMNVRALVVLPAKDDPDGHEAPVWWFGGGTDLTPYYPFVEDVRHFHRVCRDAVQPFGDALYPQLKAACDHYFYLPHRREARGVGGIFFDDLNNLDSLSGSGGTANADSRGAGYGDCAACFALVRAVGDAFTRAYLPILEKRRDLPYGERERDFQAYRRGRYVEFNLVCDRGTLFGLQSGGRTESILMSLPPVVKWRYDWQPEPGSDEARLYEMFLPPRDWL